MGWNGSDNRGANTCPRPIKAKQQRPKVRSYGFIVSAGLLFVIVGGVAVWFVRGTTRTSSAKTDREVRRQSRIAQVAPSIATNAAGEAQASYSAAENQTEAEAKPGERILSCVTNTTGYIIQRVVQPNGKILRRVIERPSDWKFGTDAVIAGALMAGDGEMPPYPPMDEGDDEVFRKSLNEPLTILESDSKELQAMKTLVAEAREEVRKRMDAGETFVEIMEDHRNLFNDNLKIRNKAYNEWQGIRRSGDEEGAKRYLNVMNAALSQMGIDPLDRDDTGDSEDVEVGN